jgi:purine-nucleoside phosphorylase
MTEQKRKITESVNYIRSKSPFKKNVSLALVTYCDPAFLKEFVVHKKIKFSEIPPPFNGSDKENGNEFLFASLKNSKKDVYILNGRLNFFEGYSMRDAAHPVYVLKALGVKTLLMIDEVGYLNPRFETGGVSLIYDHINLMGDNPLIGENDNSLGTRFPDMSNSYDAAIYGKIEKILIDKKFKFYPSVYLGITGPETETEAECRFYREIGSDVLGYGIVPENLAAIHGGLKCAAFGMISRELVADRLTEITADQQLKNRQKAEKYFGIVFKDIVSIL